LSILYLVRHGQAGTRENYDSLSELGRRQSRLLGEFFRGIQIRAAYSGSLERQRATAVEAGFEPSVDAGWDEFDLAQVYREYAPRLVEDDKQFAREYEEMQRAIAANESAVHRKWNDCDKKCVRAWIEGRYEYSGESWAAFLSRVRGAVARAVSAAQDGNVAVFTSATPIGITAARTLEIEDGRAMWLAAVMFNASVTTLRVHGDEVRLFTMNGTGHLAEAELRTFR